MALLIFKVTQKVQGGTPVTRRIPFTLATGSGDNWERAATLLKQRFGLLEEEPLALIWQDNEGDFITIVGCFPALWTIPVACS